MLNEKLRDLERAGQPIRIGIIGAGTFGTQIIAQTCRIPGMRVSAIADLKPERSRRALSLGGVDGDHVVSAKTAADIDRAIEAGRPAVTASADELAASNVQVVVEATGDAEVGARHAFEAIAHRKHIVMVTVEADVLVGYLLNKKAEEAGVCYSLAYGDEPALAHELVDWARTLGFSVVAAGKGTRFAEAFRKSTPDDVPRLYGFTGADYNAQVFCSFLDGTKHTIEMAALSNSTGLVPDVRGMHFPTCDLREIPDVLCEKERGGILNAPGAVEAVSVIHPDGSFVERGLRGGLYAVFASADTYAIESLASYGEIIGMMIGKRSGRAMIYRPQHFVGHEVPLGIARLMVSGASSGRPNWRASEVIAAAKRPLAPGTVLDGEGGYAVYGLLERADVARAEKLVPVGLTRGAEVLQDIPEGGLITYDNVSLPETFALGLRREQDALPTADPA
jgi:predicted homoserine dehydrogenase-like protein